MKHGEKSKTGKAKKVAKKTNVKKIKKEKDRITDPAKSDE